MSNRIEYTEGQLLGTCYYLQDTEYDKYKLRKAIFRCECGAIFTSTIHAVKTGNKKSCGCRPTCCTPVHGGWGSRLYSIWNGMKDRCLNSNSQAYSSYGGKGITVCEDWLTFGGFQAWAMISGYTLFLSLDRKNSNGNYEPSNCRWANNFTQAQNRGIGKNNKSGFKGVSFCKATKQYKASIGYNNQQKTLGRFPTKEEAALAYNAFVIENKLEHTLNDVQL